MTTCLNCGATLGGSFCAQCGQRAVPPRPTLRELAGDAWAELVGWDGKIARTIDRLLRAPGELTRASIEGQRVRYVSPVRLYLACSLLYFLIAAAAPTPDVTTEFDVGVGIGVGAEGATPAEAALGEAFVRGLGRLDPATRALAEEAIAAQPWFFQPTLRAMAVDYRATQRRALATIPRALFALVPVLAAIVALFYRGRHFPEHLYFAVHLQSFVFLTLTLSTLANYTRSLTAMSAAQLAAGTVILGYGVLAQRRVYGGAWPGTLFKGLGIAVLYLMAWSATVLGATVWAARNIM